MTYVWFVLIGILGGVLGGMGFGGGTILIPLLVFIMGLEQHLAQAINILAFIPMAVIALIIHHKNGYLKINKHFIWYMILIVVSALGASFLAPLISGKLLAKMFGGFLILLSFFMFFYKPKETKDCGKK